MMGDGRLPGSRPRTESPMQRRPRAMTLECLEPREVPTGAVDTSFGTNGETLVQFDAYDAPNSIVRQPDGKYLVGGSTFGVGNDDFVMARLDTGAALDPTFGCGGKGRTDPGSNRAMPALF